MNSRLGSQKLLGEERLDTADSKVNFDAFDGNLGSI
jgi:hypothetical protein